MVDLMIFVTHHKYGPQICNPLLTNVLGGPLPVPENMSMVKDNNGDNIANKKALYSELTTQYWAWKNTKHDYYGFCHYRRFISFSKKEMEEDVNGKVVLNNFVDNMDEILGYDRRDLESVIGDFDVILPKPLITTKVGIRDLYGQYSSSPYLRLKDLEETLRVIKKLYPEYYKDARNCLEGTTFYPGNMFIMKDRVFKEYCSWLFDILFKIEKQIDFSTYSEESSRTLGHLGERLLGIYIKHHEKQLKIGFSQRVMIMNTELTKPQLWDVKNKIPIFFVTSNEFVIYLTATIISIINHSSSDNNYEINILNTHISEENQNLIKKVISNRPNFKVNIINVSGRIENLNLERGHTLKHVGAESYLRLLAPEIFRDYDKIVYLDSDIIVVKDVAELYGLDIGGNLVAGVVAAGAIAEYNGHDLNIKNYFDSNLKLKDPYSYINAGVMILNLSEFRKAFREGELIKESNKNYIYMDQDVINKECQGKILLLDPRWNVMHGAKGNRTDLIRRFAPLKISKDYFESRKNPFIIHYAGKPKPWDDPNDDMCDIFWQEIRDSPIYERMLFNVKSQEPITVMSDGELTLSLARIYRDGAKVDKKQAKALMRKSANVGNITANAELIDMLTNGTPEEQKEAFERCVKYSDKNDSGMLSRLARMYRDGKGTESNIEMAIKYMRKSADLGNTYAQEELIDLLVTSGGELNQREAFEKGIEFQHKSPGINRRLASLYAQGIGTEKDIEKCRRILAPLADKDVKSRYYLIDVLITSKNTMYEKEAFERCVKYSDKNDSGMLSRLARMYRDGKGTESNIEMAIKYMRKSADLGNTYAQTELIDLLIRVGGDMNREEAFKICLLYSERSPKMKMKLAQMYRDGIGVETDIKKSEELIQSAVRDELPI